MYYKVIKNERVIDVLDKLIYLKYQPKHKRMLLCDYEEAQAFLSSDGSHAWHDITLRRLPIDGYDTVELVEIDQYEYESLKLLNLKTPEEIIDEYTLMLLNGGII